MENPCNYHSTKILGHIVVKKPCPPQELVATRFVERVPELDDRQPNRFLYKCIDVYGCECGRIRRSIGTYTELPQLSERGRKIYSDYRSAIDRLLLQETSPVRRCKSTKLPLCG